MEVSHHAFNDGDWKSTKPLVFVLDNMADLDAKDNKKSKKNKGKNLTHRNFGAFLDIGKVKCPAPLPCLEMPAPRPYSLLVFLNFNVICQ